MNKLQCQSTPIFEKYKFIIINILLICLMVTALAFTTMELIKAIWEGWDGALLPLIAFFIALEALWSRRITQDMVILAKEWVMHHIFEWVVILLLLKIYLYFLRDPTQILRDFLLWDDNFFKYFFTPEYILLVVCAVMFWLIAILYSAPLKQLEEDKDLLDQEKMGFTFNDRYYARKQLMGSIFSLGAIQLIITTALHSNLALIPKAVVPVEKFIAFLIAYFLFGFVLLAVNQYNLQKARWYLSDVPVADNVSRRWITYSAIFLLLITILVLFLPTSYALGIFPAFRYLGDLMIYIFGLVQFFVILPFIALMTLLGGLFRNQPLEVEPDSYPEFVPAQPAPPFIGDLSSWMLVKSFIFWSIFIFLTYFAIRFYIQQRKGLFEYLKSLSIISWLKQTWQRLKQLLRLAGKYSQSTIQNGLNKIRSLVKRPGINLPSLVDLARRLSPRQGIIIAYVELTFWLGKHDYQRKSSQTPAEYAVNLVKQVPDLQHDISKITTLFTRARYSRQELFKEDYKTFEGDILRLKTAIQAHKVAQQE